jgi:alpha-beta hydrolase superfamily lysophospholipase
MVLKLLSGGFKLVLLGLAIVGAGALALLVMIGTPLESPPPLASISDAVRAVDRSTMPGLARFVARDGTSLAYRHYPPRGAAVGRIAILVHGSSGSSPAIHALADALAARGVTAYAVDMRGHGASGTRGDVAYVGQLEDDLADFVAEIRKTEPSAPLTLLGHSAGGGFALRVAGSKIQDLFARTVLLAPYLGYDAPTTRPNAGGWANGDIPRIVGLALLRRIGIDGGDALPTVAFAVSPESRKILTSTYTERLRLNFGNHRDFRTDLAAATRPVALYSGTDDELMLADRYAAAVRGVGPKVDVRLIAGVNHMEIVSKPAAVSAIADDVATSGPSS